LIHETPGSETTTVYGFVALYGLDVSSATGDHHDLDPDSPDGADNYR
jgi:hypothetical protein